MHQNTIETGKEELREFTQNLNEFTGNVMPELEKAVQNAWVPPIEYSQSFN